MMMNMTQPLIGNRVQFISHEWIKWKFIETSSEGDNESSRVSYSAFEQLFIV